MKFLYKIFHQDTESRDGIITMTSSLCIVVNAFVAALKIGVGILTSSLAIISEGVNNATDALTSVLTLAGTKLARKHPDAKHPFGYGRIEYLTGLVVSVLILVTGCEMLIGSVKSIFQPEELTVSYISIIIVGVTSVIKLFLGLYTVKMGRKADSSALEAVGLECRNDSFVSVITIVSAIIFIVFGLSLDAYAGIITSLIIINSGISVLKDTVSEIIGRPGEQELAAKLYSEIRKTDCVVEAADMMLHNYGPDALSGSVNVEIQHDKTVGEIYQEIHDLQLRIMHEYNVTMVFGIYAVDNGHDFIKDIRKDVCDFVKSKEHLKSFHAIYFDTKTNTIYCDIVVDYGLKDWDALHREFIEFMNEKYPNYPVELTIETEYV